MKRSKARPKKIVERLKGGKRIFLYCGSTHLGERTFDVWTTEDGKRCKIKKTGGDYSKITSTHKIADIMDMERSPTLSSKSFKIYYGEILHAVDSYMKRIDGDPDERL